jgi:cell division septum initiation protein DivIVA
VVRAEVNVDKQDDTSVLLYARQDGTPEVNMDILYLVDRVEEIVKESRRLPFSGVRLVDERRVWPLLDQMRISIPDEVRRAERIIREKDRTLAQAHEEAERIVALARSEAAQITGEHAVAQAAEARSTAIRERAEREAEGIRAGADEYAFEVLCKLEQDLKQALTVIENGIRALEMGGAQGESQSSGGEEHESEGSETS